MEKILLPDSIGYKANLHCHSTDSDGLLTPEELKKYYMEHGYSVLAYTDHFYMRDRSSLNDENFVALSGFENSIVSPNGDLGMHPLYHMNFYSPAPDKIGLVGIAENEHKYWLKRLTPEKNKLSPLLHGYSKDDYSKENINAIIKEGTDAGYLVVCNHPVWSQQTTEDLIGLKGLCGMEIYNYGCFVAGFEEGIGNFYDQMLRDGQKISCFANDDNHNWKNYPCDSFGGYNILYAPSLTYDNIFNAIKNGDNYASSGATIRGITVRDNKVYVGTDNAQFIRLTTNFRHCQIALASEKPLTQAVFTLPEKYLKYFRITIQDTKGKQAFSRAYFTPEFQN